MSRWNLSNVGESIATQSLEENSLRDKIEALYLESNGFKKIPVCLRKYVNVKVLSLIDNSFLNLEGIGKMLLLKHLFLRQCEISTLPNDFAALSNLTNLYIERNNLEELPLNFGMLRSLELLSAGRNKLKCRAVFLHFLKFGDHLLRDT